MSTDYTQQNPYFRASNQQILHLRGVTILNVYFFNRWPCLIYCGQLYKL